MFSRAFLKYFLDINILNLPFSLILAFVLGTLWGVLFFSTFGVFIGYVAFSALKENEYFTYYNLGYTKAHLLKKVLILNGSISIFLLLIYLIAI